MSDSKLGRCIAALALWSLVLSCSNVSYDSEYDPGVDFNGYESYVWLEAGQEAQRGGPAVRETTEQRIMHAIDERLQAMGYREVSDEEADFRVNFVAAVDEAVGADAYDATMRPRWRGAQAAEARELEQAVLVIAIFDAGNWELVWRGTAEGAVKPGTEKRERNRALNEAVDGILERFPPRSK